MLPPIYYESCTDAVLAAYARLEDAILSAMVKRILRMGFVSETTKHQAEMLQEAVLLYEDILQLIAQSTDACTAQVRALFEDAGLTAVEMDNQAYRKAGIATVDIRQSDSLRQVLEAGFKKTMGVMDNLTKTTALTTQRAFYQACNDAYMQITSGAFSYQDAIRNVLKQSAKGGLSVTYPSGHVDKLDVAIRRAALTGVGQTAAEVSKANAEDNGCYLMEITAHSGARPEHAKWQGQLVSLTGKDVGKTIDGLKVWSLRGIGYGDGDGFRGWNCRHDWFPYFPGLSVPNYTKKELEQLDEKRIAWNGEKYTEYEISQMQRARERNVRKLKRQTMSMQQAAELTDNPELKEAATADYQATAAKLKAAEKDLQTFCNQTGQDRDRFREQVLGFSRSEAQKAVHAAKKSGLTSGGKDGIIKESMNRRNKNIGEFSELKIPMQKKAILNVCKKYNVETSGLRFKIQRDEKMLSMPFYGSTDYDDIGRIDLFPNAFTDEEQLIRTIIHEKCHVKQLKKHGKKYAQEHLQEMEKQAYRLESLYYHILKKRV